MLKYLIAIIIFCISCSGAQPSTTAPARLRITNGSHGVLWVFYQIGAGGGSMPTAHRFQLAAGAHIDYPIPDKGIAATRFWAGSGCDATGSHCTIGQSDGPGCGSHGCAPPVDSKFEGTFGCLPSVPAAQCQVNPSSPTHAVLPRTDSWDTSMVDGFTFPYRVRVSGNCPGGPRNETIDCSTVAMSMCPTTENLSTGNQFPTLASENMLVTNPGNGQSAGCYSDCGKLTFAQWNGMSYAPASAQAQMYCCPTPPIQPGTCRSGPVASTGYTELVHRTCPQVYAYGYDDGTGLFSCPAGARYEVTFFAAR